MSLKGNWKRIFQEESQKEYFVALQQFLKEERDTKTIFPPENLTYRALEVTPFEEVKVVLLGQDPYHNVNQAMGLSFSVPVGEKIPPSLRNIFKELEAEYQTGKEWESGDLTSWAKQGVLLLNTVLTVEAHQANSHAKKGWENFTDALITELNNREDPIVFLLLGSHAIKKETMIDNPAHRILKTTHPSPLSAYRGFLGSNIFKQTNDVLREQNKEEIQWFL